eukprot:2326109-Rhodomonas_salina.1
MQNFITSLRVLNPRKWEQIRREREERRIRSRERIASSSRTFMGLFLLFVVGTIAWTELSQGMYRDKAETCFALGLAEQAFSFVRNFVTGVVLVIILLYLLNWMKITLPSPSTTEYQFVAEQDSDLNKMYRVVKHKAPGARVQIIRVCLWLTVFLLLGFLGVCMLVWGRYGECNDEISNNTTQITLFSILPLLCVVLVYVLHVVEVRWYVDHFIHRRATAHKYAELMNVDEADANTALGFDEFESEENQKAVFAYEGTLFSTLREHFWRILMSSVWLGAGYLLILGMALDDQQAGFHYCKKIQESLQASSESDTKAPENTQYEGIKGVRVTGYNVTSRALPAHERKVTFFLECIEPGLKNISWVQCLENPTHTTKLPIMKDSDWALVNRIFWPTLAVSIMTCVWVSLTPPLGPGMQPFQPWYLGVFQTKSEKENFVKEQMQVNDNVENVQLTEVERRKLNFMPPQI